MADNANEKIISLGVLSYNNDKMKGYVQDEIGKVSGLTVDSEMSDTSENPVQNKIVKKALDEKGTYSKPSGGIPKTDLTRDIQTSLNKADNALQDSDISDWAKASTKPTYTASEVGAASASSLDSHTNNTTVHISATERTNWNTAKTHADSAHAPSNAQANVIETVKVNGTALTPNNKAVNISVPIVDSALSSTSTNALQNKVASSELNKKLDITPKIALDAYVRINQMVNDNNNVSVCEEIVKKNSDGSSTARAWRIRMPDDVSSYAELWANINSNAPSWNFTTGGNKTPITQLLVDGKRVYTNGGYSPYIVGTFTGTGSAMTISGLSFAPSRVFYYRLITGEPVLIAKRNGNGFNIDTSINTAEYEYIAFR